MPTVAQIAASADADHAWLFVIAGVPFALTTSYEIAEMGTAYMGSEFGERMIYEGLELPRTITLATQPQDGRPDTNDGAELMLTDFSRQIIAFMRDQRGEAQEANFPLLATVDPAPEFLGDNPAWGLWGKWINGEAIGPAGERAYYPILPTGDLPQEHIKDPDGPWSYIYDAPTMLEGLRCALYILWRDPETGEFADWATQYASGQSLFWVGSLTNKGDVASTVWRVSADGPSSYLRKQIGTRRPEAWRPLGRRAVLNTTEGSREDLFALSFSYLGSAEPVKERGGRSDFDTGFDVLPDTGESKDFLDALNARIETVSASAGDDVTWTDERLASALLEYDPDSDRIIARTKMDDNHVGDLWAFTALWTLTAHRRVWNALGFDPEVQNASAYEDEYQVKFVAAELVPNLDQPAPGYWQGTFWTCPVGFAGPFDATDQADNNGEWRIHRAVSPPDPVQLSAQAGDELTLTADMGGENIYKAQTNRPPGEYSFPGLEPDPGPATSQGYIAISGSYKATVESEVTKRVVIAKVNWRDYSGNISFDPDSHNPVVWAEKYIDARIYGCDSPAIKQTWSSNDLQFTWINLLGFNLDLATDHAHGVLLNLMLSSGTASWTGVEGSATLNVGINAHPDMPLGKQRYNDTETFGMGLQTPHQLINLKSFFTTANKLPGGGGGRLAGCRYAWLGETDSQELITSILEPRGYGLGFNRGKWRLFSRPALIADSDVEVILGLDDIALQVEDPSWQEKVNRRPLAPRESFIIENNTALVSDAATERDISVTVRASDNAARTRRDNGGFKVAGWGIVPYQLWQPKPVFAPPPNFFWRPEFQQHCDTLSQWYNTPQIMIEGLPIRRTKARLLGPGTVVRVTTPSAPNQEGTYGLTDKLGRVYKVEYNTDDMSAKVDILIQPGATTPLRRFAPIAIVKPMVEAVEERYDVGTRTFFVEKNGFEHDDEDLHDCTYFVSPEYLSVGGNALVHGYQWDGRAWAQTFSFSVESVSDAADSITYVAGSFNGVFKDAHYTLLVMAPYDDQPVDSWPRALFSVLTRSDYLFGAVPTQGFKLVD